MGQRLVIVLLLAALGAAAEPVVRPSTFEAHANKDGLGEGPEIQFELVWDGERREAHIRSSGGVTPLTALRGDAGETTFFVVSGTGGLTITTVMPGGEVVHSQHGAHGFQLSASQHYRRVPVRGPQQISPVRAGGEVVPGYPKREDSARNPGAGSRVFFTAVPLAPRAENRPHRI